MKELNTPVRYLKGIGPKRAEIFNRIGIFSLEDMLYYFPKRYEDRRSFTQISELKEGQIQTVKGVVLAKKQRRFFRRRGFSITEALIGDDSGKIASVWFNQPYMENYLKIGTGLILYGKVERYGSKLQLSSPEFEAAPEGQDESLNIGRISPIYTLPQGLSQRAMRQLMKNILDECLSKIQDSLPYDIREKNNLLNLAKSLLNIHFPQDLALQQEAYRRLSYEEFFLFQLPLALRKLRNRQKPGIAHQTEGRIVADFMEHLDFKLTAAQERVLQEIRHDMSIPLIMQRLLQGDVGSGKTIVAIIASLMAIQGGYQTVFMVPTEILARQHYESIAQGTAYRTQSRKEIKAGLLIGSSGEKEKAKLLREIRTGKINLIVGTHALLEEGVDFKNLGLVVIDEQHKFGVGQRALLQGKGVNPDILIMTATPIPRTLAITLYADLDISVIDELPAGRKPIQTTWIEDNKRGWLYDFLEEQLAQGRQAYIVYPIIEDSFALDLLSAKKMYSELKNNIFRDYQVGLIHGKLKQKEQERVMQQFKSGRINLLVATTILEVGIDVGNATVMVVEHAERFGLSQLHQLRGRIGRGREQSYCILVSSASSEEAKARLAAMARYNDGFRIAEEDLKIRGPGEFFGRRQHGLTELKIGNPLTQMQLLRQARKDALALTEKDPHFENRVNTLLKERLLARFPEYEKLMVVG